MFNFKRKPRYKLPAGEIGRVPVPKSPIPPPPKYRPIELGLRDLDPNVSERDIRLILSQTGLTLSDFDGVNFEQTNLFSTTEIAILTKVREYLEKKGDPTKEAQLLRKWNPAIATLLKRQNGDI